MTSKKFLSGMSAIALVFVFGLVLAGCASAYKEGPASDINAAAEKLASDINAIKPGSAEVNGSTVTLTEDVRLETTLTVPLGVTLDLTKETLHLANNTIFTVEGMVNGKGDSINIDSVAENPATVNGSGTIQLKSKGRLFGIWDNKKLILDGVALVGLKDNDKPVVEIGNGGEFVLKSGTITGNNIFNDNMAIGVGVRIDNGKFTMEGGTISGNIAKGGDGAFGGGVAVNGEGATFSMQGGSISGNTADLGINEGGRGGGVGAFNSGTFIMEDGTIFGNTSEYGGGVLVTNRAKFTMKGGRIQGGTDSDGFAKNTATNSDGGSALYVYNIYSSAKWGMGGTYTKDGVSQTGDSNLVEFVHLSNDDWDWRGITNDTLIAVP
jgi:hypothetical protein